MTAEIVKPAAQSAVQAGGGRGIVALVTALFFVWGFATVLVDTLIPRLKALFDLTFTEVMLTQFSFFIAYFIVSVPAGQLIARIGYMRGIVAGLVIMAAGGLLFAPAAELGLYTGFLVALFVLASGITILQVAANPLIAVLGDTAGSHSRLTLAQAFNSLGTTIGPWVGAILILQNIAPTPDPATVTPAVMAAFQRSEAQTLQAPFVMIAAVLLLMAAIFWLVRHRSNDAGIQPAEAGHTLRGLLASHPRLALGTLAIFAYVGAEVSIGSVLINFLMQSHTLALAAVDAGKLVSFYWGGAMVGRFIGSGVLRIVSPGKALACCALAAVLLASTSALSGGTVAAVAVIAIGLCNSIMFPTIFSLAIEGLGSRTARGSGILCLAIVGGAIVPLVTGAAADLFGLSLSLLVPALCYLFIAGYGWSARASVQAPAEIR
jgi:FHS family L-fucose permease-like MFS transporter